jgi:16S rRNA (guanine527-N7)-methyltransferase
MCFARFKWQKNSFLKQFIADLKLTNVIAVQTRVENEDSIHDLGQFDVITSRAFATHLLLPIPT